MPKYIILAALLIITSFSIPPNVESGKRGTREGILYKIRATKFNKKVREFKYLAPPPYQEFFDIKRVA